MIDFINVSIAFGTQSILEDASFRIGAGDRIGIVGSNGSGKSTIFNLLTGELQPDSGKIASMRNLSMGYLRQQLRPYSVDSTILEYSENALPAVNQIQKEIDDLEHALPNLAEPEKSRTVKRLGELQSEFEHIGGYDLNSKTKAALCGLGFKVDDLNRPFNTFSGGWQMRAELARALVARPDILLLDEPTNFLDIPAVEWLQRFLRDFKGTLLLIAHDRFLLNTLTNCTLEVSRGQVSRYSGNYDNYVRERQSRHETLLAAKKNQDRQIAQVERFIDRFRAKNTKAAQVQSRIKQLEKIDEIVIPHEAMRATRIRLPTPPYCGDEVMRLEDAGVNYDGSNWVLRNVELRIVKGEKTALVGFNGLGKTTLLRIIAGRLPLIEGKRVTNHRVKIGYHAQDFAENMDPEQTVLEAARSAAPSMSENELRSVLGSFYFPGDSIEKKIEVLSGGEKMRLSLARLLLQAPNFLLLDEPTTHLDIPSRESLEQALMSYQGTVFFVSHDVEFVKRVATTIIAMVPGNIKRYAGDFTYYHEKLAQETGTEDDTNDEPAERGASTLSRKALRQERAKQRQALHELTKDLKKKIAQTERQMATFEQEQKRLVELLSKAETDETLNYPEIGRNLKALQAEMDIYSKRWEQYYSELEKMTGGKEID